MLNLHQRVGRLQEEMVSKNLDLVVYGNCQNFQYLTDLIGGEVESVIDWRSHIDVQTSEANNIFIPRVGDPILTLSSQFSKHAENVWISDTRLIERDIVRTGGYPCLVAKVLGDLEVTNNARAYNHVGIGDHVYGSTIAAIQNSLRHVKLFAAEAMMDSQRMIKNTDEINRLRKVAKLTDRVVNSLISKIQVGISQDELQQHIMDLGYRFGASDVSFSPTVGYVQLGSKPSLNISNVAKDMGLKPNTTIFLDIGFVLKGYCSDFGRSFFIGSPNKEVRKGYEALQQSVLDVVDEMHAGSMRVCDIYPKLEKKLSIRGFGNELRARLGKSQSVGHSIGIEVHEPPRLNPYYDEVLCENMVLAVEPKIWSPGDYYLRVEDLVLVGAKKTEFLTEFDRDLFYL